MGGVLQLVKGDGLKLVLRLGRVTFTSASQCHTWFDAEQSVAQRLLEFLTLHHQHWQLLSKNRTLSDDEAEVEPFGETSPFIDSVNNQAFLSTRNRVVGLGGSLKADLAPSGGFVATAELANVTVTNAAQDKDDAERDAARMLCAQILLALRKSLHKAKA